LIFLNSAESIVFFGFNTKQVIYVYASREVIRRALVNT